jgi:hypothetical protein
MGWDAERRLPETRVPTPHLSSMQFANEHEIEFWCERFRADPVLAAAAETLRSLKDAVNGCSDGWPYWQAPARSAQTLVGRLADADRADRRAAPHGLTAADLDRAYRPIKAFRTRYGAKYGFDVDFHYPPQPSAAPEALSLFP